MIKLLLSIITMIFLTQLSFAKDTPLCNISEYSNGYNGKLSFKCNERISLSDNKVVFYIVGIVELDRIDIHGVKAKFKTDQISKGLAKVTVNLVTEGVLYDGDYMVDKDRLVNLRLIFSGDSNPKYKVLWGGVIKNSYKQTKIKSDNIQIYRNLNGRVYLYMDGLKCAIGKDCDDKIYIDKDCKNNKNCNKFNNDGNNRKIYGLVY